MTRIVRDRVLGDLANLISAHGWALQGVFGDTPDSMFTYTVGLTEKGLPELWLGTLSPRQAGPILNDLARLSISRDGLPVGEPLDIEWSVPFRLRGPVTIDDSEAFAAKAMYGEEAVTVLQGLWADSQGRSPDEDGYDALRFPQRLVECVGGACQAINPTDGSSCMRELGHTGRHISDDPGRDDE